MILKDFLFLFFSLCRWTSSQSMCRSQKEGNVQTLPRSQHLEKILSQDMRILSLKREDNRSQQTCENCVEIVLFELLQNCSFVDPLKCFQNWSRICYTYVMYTHCVIIHGLYTDKNNDIYVRMVYNKHNWEVSENISIISQHFNNHVQY